MVALQHLHLPGLTPYAYASHLQQILVSRLLASKTRPQALAASQTQQLPWPSPTIITFTPSPVYTTGRRESTPPSTSQLEHLKTPLLSPPYGLQTPDFTPALRGGQTTFHGPGQLVIYPIFSLSHPASFPSSPVKLTPRCYVNLLESVTIKTLASYSINGIRTPNPGVWVNGDNKIAALGVHLRRNITSHGVGLNVHTDLRWFERIVACGLEGKGVTSMMAEKPALEGRVTVEGVAERWVRVFAEEVDMDLDDVVRVSKENVLNEDAGVEIR